MHFLQEEWRRQKAQLTATLERAWAKSIAWTTPTTASLDNRQGHLNTQLKLSSGWINYYTKVLTAKNETFISRGVASVRQTEAPASVPFFISVVSFFEEIIKSKILLNT